MKALILAAGFGSRLRPITEKVPKCLVPVNGRPILEQQIKCLLNAGVQEVYVVGGYKFDILSSFLKEKYPQVNLIENKEYETTNNMYSLFKAKSIFQGQPFLLLNGDVYLAPEIISDLNKGPDANLIAVDKGRYIEESMKVVVADNKLSAISKAIAEADAYGVSIDVYRFDDKGSKAIFDIATDYIENKNEKSLWTEFAINDAFNLQPFRPFDIRGPWFEIDNHQDLATAENIFRDRHDP